MMKLAAFLLATAMMMNETYAGERSPSDSLQVITTSAKE